MASRVLALLVACGVLSGVALADWGAVREAYQRGDAAALVKALRPIAREGDAIAQYNLAVLYDTGQGVPRDHVKAARWYAAAAEQGYAGALYNLGVLYFEGEGVEMDREESLRLHKEAARQGEPDSLSSIGYLHLHGIEVKKDRVEAMAHFLLAAERGSLDGERNRDQLIGDMDTNDVAFARRRLQDLRTLYPTP